MSTIDLIIIKIIARPKDLVSFTRGSCTLTHDLAMHVDIPSNAEWSAECPENGHDTILPEEGA